MTEDKYEVHSCVPEAAIRVCRTKDPQLSLKITLSSLAMREDTQQHSSGGEGIDTATATPTAPTLHPLPYPVFYDLYMTKGGVDTGTGRGVLGDRVTQACKSMNDT